MRLNPFNYTGAVAGGDSCGHPKETLRGTFVNIGKISGMSKASQHPAMRYNDTQVHGRSLTPREAVLEYCDI